MILVVLGTQDKPFTRLLEALDAQKKEGLIQDEIIVQAGCTKIDTDSMKLFDLLPIDEFDTLINDADVIITHAGVGSILSALKKGKKVIACARLAQYGEHTNDHQLQIQEEFARQRYLISCEDFSKINEIIKKLDEFKPNPYISTTENVVNTIRDFIRKH